MGFLLSLFHLLPPRLVGHLEEFAAVKTQFTRHRSTRRQRNLLHLGTPSDPVHLGEGAVEGVEEVQRAAGCPHPALVPRLWDQRQLMHLFSHFIQ